MLANWVLDLVPGTVAVGRMDASKQGAGSGARHLLGGARHLLGGGRMLANWRSRSVPGTRGRVDGC
jgi:hypothetical protein